MDSIKVLVIGSSAFASNVIAKLLIDKNTQELEIISVTDKETIFNHIEPIIIPNFDIDKIIEIALARRVSLTIPCEPSLFALGIVDKFKDLGLNIFGPDQASSRLESSKFFFKEFTHSHSIPSPNYASFESKEMSLVYLQNIQYPVLIQPDNLYEREYENKQFIADNFEEARSFVELYYSKLYLCNSAKRLISEEYSKSEHISFTVIYDGENAFSLVPIKNNYEFNKLSFSFSEMTAFSSEDTLSSIIIDKISQKIIEPCIDGFKKLKLNYSGFINFNCKVYENDRVELLSISSCLSDLNSGISLQLLDENLFDLLFACSQRKLAFYREGLHRKAEAAVAYNLIYDYSILSSITDEEIESLEEKANTLGYKLQIKNRFDEINHRDLIQIINFANNQFEAKSFAQKTIKELNLAGKEYIKE